MGQENTQKELLASLFQELKRDITSFIPVALCVIGDTMESTNAEEMHAEVECRLSGEQYKVEAKFTLFKL